VSKQTGLAPTQVYKAAKQTCLISKQAYKAANQTGFAAKQTCFEVLFACFVASLTDKIAGTVVKPAQIINEAVFLTDKALSLIIDTV
jgi:hypothetical protein